MHVTTAWIGPLVAGGLGALALTGAATLLRREIAELQKSMRPLRVARHRDRSRPGPR